MNYGSLKEKIRHGDAMFPLEVHRFETDIRSDERLNCHWHDELEFLVVTEGGARFHIDERSYRVAAGEIIIVNSNRLHYATAIDNMPCSFFAVVFSPDLLTGPAQDLIRQKYVDPVLNTELTFPEWIRPEKDWEKRIFARLFEIQSAFAEKAAAYELLIKTKLCEIWYLLLTHARSEGAAVRINDYRVTRIKAVLEYMHARYQEKLSLGELSAAFGMSEGQFCRFFRSMVRSSVVDYINAYRIRESVALLRETDREIGEIACAVGFCNISYFNKVFRKYMRCSPSELRKNG